MRLFKSKKANFGLENLSWQQRRYLFIFVSLLSGLFLFQPTSGLVSWLTDYKIESLPFINGQNLLGIGLVYLGIALIYHQVA